MYYTLTTGVKRMTKIVTIVVTALTLAVLLGWDLVANFNQVKGDTVSEVLGAAFRSAPILAVVLGVIVGHLASNFPGVEGLVNFIGARPAVGALVGFAVGFLFWNMNRG